MKPAIIKREGVITDAHTSGKVTVMHEKSPDAPSWFNDFSLLYLKEGEVIALGPLFGKRVIISIREAE
jgi:hypothetical protein